MATDVAQQQPTASSPPRKRGRVLRAVGWVMIAAGVVVLLYVVYSLYFTGLETQRAQSSMLETWQEEVGPIPFDLPEADEILIPDTPDVDAPEPVDPLEPPDVGDAVAVIAFERPGSDVRPVHDDFIMIVEGTGVWELTQGPGHYRDTALPGEDGNFAVAGHRTTYDAPFHRLDELQDGDLIHVWDRSGAHHVYRHTRQEIVRPVDTWVIGTDPLETGQPTITLTTCHPRFSNRQRLIAFGELIS